MEDDLEQAEPDGQEILGVDPRRYFEALRKYVWALLALLAVAVAGAIVFTSRQTSIYEAQASVQIEPKLPDLLGQGQEILTGVAGGTKDYYAQQRKILGSYHLIRQTVESHQLYNIVLSSAERAGRNPDDLVEEATARVQKMITIRYPDDDRIMYVVVRSSDPSLAANIANEHVATYLDYSKGLISLDSEQASNALATQFDDAEAKLRAAETALYQFQKDNDLLAVSLEERQSLTSSDITTYSLKLDEERARQFQLQALLDRIAKRTSEDVLTSPVLSLADANSSSFDSLRAQYYSERNHFIELEKQVGPKTVEYQMQKAKVDDLHSALQTEADRVVGGLKEQLQASIATQTSLQGEIERATKEALALGPKAEAYDDLLRKKKSIEDRYNILRTRLATSEMTGQMNGAIDTNVRPLDPALVPTGAVFPKLSINISVAVVLALLVGFGLVFLIVIFDRSIKSAADATQASSAPLLGIIPLIERADTGGDNDANRDLYVHRNPSSNIAECCRSVRTNILFSAADRPLKTIVVSSASPREGKTTSVIYLGTTMAQSGQRVLMIDTDLRRPRLHTSLGVSGQVGLSNLILSDREHDGVIKSTEIANLFVLPCGPLPPNPAELLMTQRFKAILDELAQKFDRIILDSPPLTVVTDAVVLSKHADGVILIARSGKTVREQLKRSARLVRNVQGKIFGVIVNAINPDKSSSYGYYYGYTEKSVSAREA